MSRPRKTPKAKAVEAVQLSYRYLAYPTDLSGIEHGELDLLVVPLKQ